MNRGPRGTEARHWVCVGAITAAVGVSGDVRIRPYTETPEGLMNLRDLRVGEDHDPIQFAGIRPAKAGLVASIAGINTREEAERLKGRRLYVRRADLPPAGEEEYYYADLVGLRVEDLSGKEIGRLQAIHNFGAGDLLEIALSEGRKMVGRSPLVPFTRKIVPIVDITAGLIAVDLEGWIESWIEAQSPGSEAIQNPK